MCCKIARIEFWCITIHILVVKKCLENSELILVLVNQSVLVDRNVAEILILLVLNINQSIMFLWICCRQAMFFSQHLTKQSFQNYSIVRLFLTHLIRIKS